LIRRDDGPLESTSAMAASSLATPLVQLLYVYAGRDDRAGMEKALDAASRLSPNPGIREALRSILPAADSPAP